MQIIILVLKEAGDLLMQEMVDIKPIEDVVNGLRLIIKFPFAENYDVLQMANRLQQYCEWKIWNQQMHLVWIEFRTQNFVITDYRYSDR